MMLRIPLGERGVHLYDEVLAQRFEKVTRVERPDAEDLGRKGIAVIDFADRRVERVVVLADVSPLSSYT